MPKFTVENGKSYEAKIKLVGFEVMASNDQVVDKLRELGFSNLEVTGEGDIRDASGTWTGQTATVDLPEQIAKIDEVVIAYTDDGKKLA